ncbi:MAG: holin [Clostridia bacterium]|nr:holin [Clostridia bacterium]
MEFLEGYFELVVIGICLCLGYIIKNLIPSDKINKFIPLIMGVTGAFINLWVNAFALTPQIILTGLVSGLASTGMYEMFAQFIKNGGKE